MASQQVVINPFAKNDNRMRRNTENTRWVADSDGTKAGPSKDAQYVTQSSQYDSQKASVYDELYEISPLSRTHVLPQDRTKPLPPYPGSYKYARRDSPVSAIGPVDFSGLEQARKQSVATVFPFYPASVKKPEVKTKEKEPWWKAAMDADSSKQGAIPTKKTQSKPSADTPPTPWYRLAREIYKVGPKGESQKAWKAYQDLRKEKRIKAEPTQKAPSHTRTKQQEKKYEKPLPPAPPSNPSGVLYPPLRPRPAQSQKGKEPESPHPRKDSGFSSTSYEVPLAIDKSLQRTVDANKPLPRVPQLDPAPKARKAYQQPQSAEENAHLNPWWKPHTAQKPGLKSKISHPGPLINGTTANIAAECGGVGGPAAAVSMPICRNGAPQLPSNPSHERMSERKKGKQKAVVERDDTAPTHWREKFEFVSKPKKRRGSDESFGCRGVGGGMGLDRYQVGEQASSSEGEEERDRERGMVPKALFTGKRAVRGTRVYQPYVEILDEY
jgi:hypothetical protein